MSVKSPCFHSLSHVLIVTYDFIKKGRWWQTECSTGDFSEWRHSAYVHLLYTAYGFVSRLQSNIQFRQSFVAQEAHTLFFLTGYSLDSQVSLDSRVRETINRNMLEPNLHTFDDAQLQIYTLMQRDSYPRYMNSPAYKNLLNTLSEQSPES